MLATGLAHDGLADEQLELLVGASPPHGRLEIDLPVDHQAGAQSPVRRKPQPVAGMAEIVADGADEADDTPCALEPEAPGRTPEVLLLFPALDGEEPAQEADAPNLAPALVPLNVTFASLQR